MSADEEDVENILLHAASAYTDNDEDMKDGVDGPAHEPVITQYPFASRQPEVNEERDIDEEGNDMQHKETRAWRKQEKGKARAFGVENEGGNIQRHHISIDDDANDEDDDCGNGDGGRL